MNLTRLFAAVSVCGALVACGGEQKPAVNPAPKDAPAKVAAAPAQNAPVKGVAFADRQDRYSYALGMDLGKAIANVNAPINMMLLMSAIQDVVDTNRKVLMDDTTAESALQDLLLLIQQKKEAADKAQAQKALDDQNKFLAQNKLDSTVKVTPKGVQYKVIKEGTGLTPHASDKVQVHYVGSLLDGTEFDNSVKRGEPLEFPVNAVIEGWQDLLLQLKEGEKVKAWIPSALAYGEAGVPPMIPANSMLIFEVELLKVFAEVPPADSAAVTAPADTVAPAAASVPADSASVKSAPASTAAPADAAKPAEPAKK